MKTKEAIRSSERYICLGGIGGEGHVWYLMDLEELKKQLKKKKKNKNISNNGEVCLVEPLLSVPLVDSAACSASTGTCFYFLGGFGERVVAEDGYIDSFHGLRRALIFDATKPEKGFVDGPQMKHRRYGAKARAFKGKIYILGGGPLQEECFGECFDPKSQEWTCIAFPRGDDNHIRYLCGIFTIFIPYDECHFLLGPFGRTATGATSVSYFLYNVETNTWNIYLYNSPLHYFRDREPAKVGDTLYYRLPGRHYKYGDICGLNLETGLHYVGPVVGGTMDRRLEETDSLVTTSLFHLGGNEFSFFTVLESASSPYTQGICCIKVRVVERDDGQDYDVTLVSALSIPIDQAIGKIMETTPVDEMFVKTLRPDTEKADGSGVLARIGKWVLGIGVVGLLSMVATSFSGRVDRTGSKQCVAPHADEGLNLDKQAAVHKVVIAEDAFRKEKSRKEGFVFPLFYFWNN